MDDGIIICNNRDFLEECVEGISSELAKLDMKLHEKKTQIIPLSQGIKILGFTFYLTDTGKVLRILDPDNVKHERKKLVRMAAKVSKGEMTEKKMREGYAAWRSHASLGNSFLLLQRMDKYVETLLKGAKDACLQANRNAL